MLLAQDDGTPKKRIHSPAKVHSFIGGEAHDSYVIRARKGQVMTVEISWKRRGGNWADFSVSRSADFFSGDPLKYSGETDKGKRWSGKLPATGDYYIYVIAHPTAKYRLRVMLK